MPINTRDIRQVFSALTHFITHISVKFHKPILSNCGLDKMPASPLKSSQSVSLLNDRLSEEQDFVAGGLQSGNTSGARTEEQMARSVHNNSCCFMDFIGFHIVLPCPSNSVQVLPLQQLNICSGTLPKCQCHPLQRQSHSSPGIFFAACHRKLRWEKLGGKGSNSEARPKGPTVYTCTTKKTTATGY